MAQIEYVKTIESLNYLLNYTRPNITCVVGRMSRYTHNLNQAQWFTVVKLFKYINGTSNYNLCYSGSPTMLEGYCDVNWISDTLGTKSTSGYVFILCGDAVS